MVDKINIQKLNCWFGDTHSVKGLSFDVKKNEILGIIGPANSGKTTFLRTINRLNDLNEKFRSDGSIKIDSVDINAIDPETLRKRCGMVFALPLSLPMSVYDNVAYGPKRHGKKKRSSLMRPLKKL